MLFEDLVTDWKNRYLQLVGPDADVSEKSIAYMLSYPILYGLHNLYNQRQQDLDATNIYKASGKYLDDLLGNFLFRRRTATKARVYVASSDSISGTVIPVGALTVRGNGVEFTNIKEGLVSATGAISLLMESGTSGSVGNVAANVLTEIVTPIAGLNTVNNPEASTGGQDEETDAEYRKRFLTAPNGDSFWNMAGLKKALMSLPGVVSTFVQKNDLNITAGGMPPHSMRVVVEGGNAEDIANVIYTRAPYETTKLGDVSVQVYDETLQQSFTIKFARPTEVSVECQINCDGNVDMDYLNTVVGNYIDSEAVGGVLSSFKAASYIQARVNLATTTYLDVTFRRLGDTLYSTYLTLQEVEKARAVI